MGNEFFVVCAGGIVILWFFKAKNEKKFFVFCFLFDQVKNSSVHFGDLRYEKKPVSEFFFADYSFK